MMVTFPVLIQIYIFMLMFVFTFSSHVQKRHDLFLKSLENFRSNDDKPDSVHIHKPMRTNRHGQFVDYVSLEILSSNSDNAKMRRPKIAAIRSTGEDINPFSAIEDGNHEVFLDLGDSLDSPLSGHRLHLKRNYKLVSQAFTVEERSKGGKIVRRHNLVSDCHYNGVIYNHNSFSKVALSLCNGVQGIVLKDNDTYFIEPMWNYTRTKNLNTSFTTSSPLNELGLEEESHPHVIIKRSLGLHHQSNDELGHCGFTDKIFGKIPWWQIDPREKDQGESKIESNAGKSDEGKTKPKQHRTHNHGHFSHERNNNQIKKSATYKNSLDRRKREVDESQSRRKRSISRERNVETLIVADKSLVVYHGREEVEKYILIIMNIVASLYHDASIGNAINIIVTRIILLTEDQPDLQITHHGDQTLDSFCAWQSRMNINSSSSASDSGLVHHDNAILLTGYDICTYKDEPCGTLGLAPVAGMCASDRSCNINEDTGLSSAFTIAHEMGHNFGMQHDGNLNSCGSENGAPAQIMAAQLTKNASPFSWSRCSKNYITKFLDSSSANCLLNSPPLRDFAFPEELPGQMFGADEQCRFQYGALSRQCRIGDTCRELWCLAKNERCVTNSVPAAEGTNCTSTNVQRGWCYRGTCVRYGYRADGVDGAWGGWTLWSECSRTCDGGASSSSRSCNSPPPQHGGKYCIGARMRYRLCNLEACPGPASDFRTEQCQRFDTEPFRGKYYNWLPYVGDDEVKPCALNCLAHGFNFYTERAAAVVDGTKCFANSRDVCINGECHHVGCDFQLHSDAIEDKCRVCGGDGSTCQTESGVFDQPVEHGQYHDIVTIPAGSVNIFIEELKMSLANYIALRSADNVDYINGGWSIDWPRKFEIAGTTFIYKRPKTEPESLHALGPTQEDLVLMVILQEENRGLRYEFNLPLERHASGDADSAFLWEHGEFSPCTASCAGGTQRRPVVCRRVDDDTNVQHTFCDPATMPIELEQACNAEPCPPMWKAGSWSECSRTCGGGHYTRAVICIRKMTQREDEVIDNSRCPAEKPRASGQCGTNVCPPEWITGRWSSCKGTCGVGYKTRDVRCMSSDRRIAHSDETICNTMLKPSTRVQCNNGVCPPPRWHYGKWGSCSAECGRGLRRRRVVCIDPKTSRQSNQCSAASKPRTKQQCDGLCLAQPSTNKACVDDPKVQYCHLVRKYKLCSRDYFRRKCCHTCTR